MKNEPQNRTGHFQTILFMISQLVSHMLEIAVSDIYFDFFFSHDHSYLILFKFSHSLFLVVITRTSTM